MRTRGITDLPPATAGARVFGLAAILGLLLVPVECSLAAPHSLFDPPDHQLNGSARSLHQRDHGDHHYQDSGSLPANERTPIAADEDASAARASSVTVGGAGVIVRAQSMAGEAAAPLIALPSGDAGVAAAVVPLEWPTIPTPDGRSPEPSSPPPRR